MNPEQLAQFIRMLKMRGVPDDRLIEMLSSPEAAALAASLPLPTEQPGPAGVADVLKRRAEADSNIMGQRTMPWQRPPLVTDRPRQFVSSTNQVPTSRMPSQQVPARTADITLSRMEFPQPTPNFTGGLGTGSMLPEEVAMTDSSISNRVPTPTEKVMSDGGGEMSELPFQTFQRLTGQKWTGGSSAPILAMLRELGITGPAGSAETNTALQEALLRKAMQGPQQMVGPAELPVPSRPLLRPEDTPLPLSNRSFEHPIL